MIDRITETKNTFLVLQPGILPVMKSGGSFNHLDLHIFRSHGPRRLIGIIPLIKMSS